jgi:hypothetical protein
VGADGKHRVEQLPAGFDDLRRWMEVKDKDEKVSDSTWEFFVE